MERLIQKNIQRLYNKYAENFDNKMQTLNIYDESYSWLGQKLAPGDRVLDLACGPGNISAFLTEENSELRITGVDLSEAMVERARKRVPQGTFLKGDICTVNTGMTYEAIICGFAIPYLSLKKIPLLLRNIRKHIADEGLLYLSFMNGNKEGYEKTSFTGEEELYIYYHPKEVIINLLSTQGFTPEKEFIVDYPESDGSVTKEVIYICSLKE